MIDIVGHIAYASLLLGQILLTKKNTWGWALRFIGEIGWVAIGFIIGMSSIWVWGILFALIDIRGFIKWRKEKKNETV